MWSGNNGFSSIKAINDKSQDKNDNKNIPLGSSAEKEQVDLSMNKYQFNSEGFQIEYGNAKFCVIKSYNEDNIHKSVKYNVWSSTPAGNKKLDATYRDNKK